MLKGFRYFLADLAYWIRSHLGRAALAGLGLLALVGVGFGGYLGVEELSGDDAPPPEAPAPQVIVRTEEAPEETADLGFPAFATRNTTRVGGPDPTAAAAGVALATFPSTGGVEGPDAVTLLDAEDWPGGIAASVLVADPVRAPILLSEDGELDELTAQALRSLAPRGSAATNDRQVFRIGDAADPPGARSLSIAGENPAALAAEVASLRDELTSGPPEHVVVASSDEPAFAMPAAGWAARSGDPVLFAQRDSVPAPTLKTLERYEDVPVYLLGPESVLSRKVESQLEKVADKVVRVGDEDPVDNAIAFARFVDGSFGWNINDPGHGFVLVNTERPIDAALASPLSASGTWGPLLVTDDAAAPPPALESYLLDLKPGYEDDPTRAVYNHVWVIGDEESVSVDFQARVDEIAEVAPIRAGGGGSVLGPSPGAPEPEQELEPGGGANRGADGGGRNGGGGSF